jgi:hypothetical protein
VRFQALQSFSGKDGVGVGFAKDLATACKTSTEESKCAIMITGFEQGDSKVAH